MMKFDVQRFIPPHVAGLKGYHAKDPVPFAPDVLKMDLNECLVQPSPRVLAAVRTAVDRQAMFNWYPDSACTALRQAIGRYLHVPADHLLVTNGSNMIMEVFVRAFLGADDPVLIVSPVYDVFDVQCKLQRTRTNHFYFSAPFEPDFAELLNAPGEYKVIYLANPNNPTGVGYPHTAIENLLETRRDSLIVLDEAYHEFYGVSCVDLIQRFPNLIILRSFSKAFSLAGLRCGYLVADPLVLEVAQRALAPWPVNGLTQIAACEAIQDVAYMRSFVADCNRARQTLVAGLQTLGFNARNCHGNFILWQVPNPKLAATLLATRKIYVSNKDAVPQLKGHLRVTIGTTEQASRFLSLVQELLPQLLAAVPA